MGKSPIKWKQLPDKTIAVDWDIIVVVDVVVVVVVVVAQPLTENILGAVHILCKAYKSCTKTHAATKFKLIKKSNFPVQENSDH